MSKGIALLFDGVEFGFGGSPLFFGLTLSFESGRFHAVLGPDGAGKTTLLRLAVGICIPDRGTVRLLGSDPRKRKAVVGRFGYLPKRFSLYGDMTVEENMEFYGRSFGLSGEILKRRVADLLERVKLSAFRKRYARDLSGGMMKKLGVMCNLLHEPEILLLDEPTTGIDPVSRSELWEFLLTLVEEKGTTLVLTTPYMEEAERADEVVFLSKGRVRAKGTFEELKREIPVRVYRLTGPRDALGKVADELPREWCQWMGGVLRVTVPRERSLRTPGNVRVEDIKPNLEDLFLARLCKF